MMNPVSAGQAGPAVFFDKDGTLIEDVPYNVDPALIELAAGARELLVQLHEAGYRIVVVSNQSGVARGLFAEEALVAVEQRLTKLLREFGVPLAGFYYCPHLPKGKVLPYAIACGCRKPAPGLILRAAREHALDLARSWMVGDILDDIEAGRRAGCRTILLDNGGETAWRRAPLRTPDAIVPDLPAAARLILASGLAATPPPPSDLTLCEAGR